MFDYAWRVSDSLAQPGNAEIRAKGRLLRGPSARFSVDPRILDSYVGRYQIEQGPLIEVFKDGTQLKVRQQGESDADDLVPTSDTDCVLPRVSVWVSFVRDASGKVTGFIGYSGGSDFAGQKLD
jgi:hypothetical protein